MTEVNGNGIKHTRPPVDVASFKTLGMAAYRAPSLVQPHRAREAIIDAHTGKIPPMIGFFCAISSPALVKVVAQLGYDVVGIDWEHNSTNVETMTQMVHDIQFFSEGKTIAWVRVPDHSHANIGYALDAGAGLVMVPQVDTLEQARHVVAATKFGVKNGGNRSAPPARFLPGLGNGRIDESLSHWENLNRQAALIIQIECVEGLDNLDEILTGVGEHIDSVWLGTLDLRISMGLDGPWGAEPEFLEQVARFEKIMAKHNKPCSGFAMGPPEVKTQLARGKSLLVTHADAYALLATMQDLAATREMFPARDVSSDFKQS